MFGYTADSRDIKTQTAPLRVPGEMMPDFTLVSTAGRVCAPPITGADAASF